MNKPDVIRARTSVSDNPKTLTRRSAIIGGIGLTTPVLLQSCGNTDGQTAASEGAPIATSEARKGTAVATSPMKEKPLATHIADYIFDAKLDDFSIAVVEKAKEQLIYHAGLALSGALTKNGRQAVAIAGSLTRAPGPSTVIGHSLKTGSLEAAFANSMFIRALGRDDVLFPSATHAGLLTYPVALAVGEQFNAAGDDILTAVIVGYEVLGKMTVNVALDRLRRPSMPFGPFASTAVAAKLMGLSREQIASAIGYAADSAMGLKAGHEQQPTHIYGLIARNSIMSAIIAKAGGETSPTILEEQYGYYPTVVGMPPPLKAIENLGIEPEILRATQKRYPGTAMNIVPIELLRSILMENKLGSSAVDRVEIELPEDRSTFNTSISPGPYPTRTQAESSVVFQAAIMLRDGDNQNSVRFDHPNVPEIRAEIEKISVRLIRHSNDRYARLTVHKKDGTIFTKDGAHHDFPPLDGKAWLRKDGETLLPGERLDQFAASVRRMENVRNVTSLMSLLAADA